MRCPDCGEHLGSEEKIENFKRSIKTAVKFMEDSKYHEYDDSEPEFQMWRDLANLIHPHGYTPTKRPNGGSDIH